MNLFWPVLKHWQQEIQTRLDDVCNRNRLVQNVVPYAGTPWCNSWDQVFAVMKSRQRLRMTKLIGWNVDLRERKEPERTAAGNRKPITPEQYFKPMHGVWAELTTKFYASSVVTVKKLTPEVAAKISKVPSMVDEQRRLSAELEEARKNGLFLVGCAAHPLWSTTSSASASAASAGSASASASSKRKAAAGLEDSPSKKLRLEDLSLEEPVAEVELEQELELEESTQKRSSPRKDKVLLLD